jgi:hypothetical protein
MRESTLLCSVRSDTGASGQFMTIGAQLLAIEITR